MKNWVLENSSDFLKIQTRIVMCPEPTIRKLHENIEERWQEELMPVIELFKEGHQKTKHVNWAWEGNGVCVFIQEGRKGLGPKQWASWCWADTQGDSTWMMCQEAEINKYTFDLGPQTEYLKTRDSESSRISLKKLVSPLGLSSGFQSVTLRPVPSVSPGNLL